MIEWVSAKNASAIRSEFLSESRDVFTGRLSRLKVLLKQGLASEWLPLVISTVGEIGNNTFDHNLGQWRDVPGCWVETQVTGKLLWICVADRGQGIFRSLSRMHPSLSDEKTALHAAFEKIISGRAPEQRGNGLKFVRRNFSETGNRGLACLSGTAFVSYGDLGEKAEKFLKKNFKSVHGTVTVLVWGLS